MMNEFDFQRVKEVFHDGVVPAVTLAARRAGNPMLEQPLIVTGRVLDAAIGMMQHATATRTAVH